VSPDDTKQANWDAASIDHGLAILRVHAADPYNKARLIACQASHSGDWLNAWPITACGLRLDDEAIRVAVGLRLGANLCHPHECPCGLAVDARGHHGLACRQSAGRQPRHALLNDTIHRALVKAGIPAVKEPSGLLRSDGKRPDGCTLIPLKNGNGKCLTWDVTAPDTLAASHLADTSHTAGAAAESAARLKHLKYSELSRTHDFVPIAVETMGPICKEGVDFISRVGSELSNLSGDPRETSFLFQRISIIVQRCNYISFRGSFMSPPVD
jgi:hypothetical protein